MNIHVKCCEVCGKYFDYPECPYCREKLKEVKENGERKTD